MTVPGFENAPTKNKKLLEWVEQTAALTQPDRIEWSDGSQEEWDRLTALLVEQGTFIKLNEAKIAAVDQQAERARRLLQAGQGTVTDLRDIEVKVSQAKAQQLAFKTQQQIALKQYEVIVGELPKASEFVLPTVHGKYNFLPMQQYAQLALQGGPNVLSARYSLQIAEFDVKKIKASFLPVMTK